MDHLFYISNATEDTFCWNWAMLTDIPLPGRPIRNLPESIDVSPDASAAEIYKEIAKASKFDIHRLRVTKGSDGAAIPNGSDVKVHDTGVRNKSAIDVKDLGTFFASRHPYHI